MARQQEQDVGQSLFIHIQAGKSRKCGARPWSIKPHPLRDTWKNYFVNVGITSPPNIINWGTKCPKHEPMENICHSSHHSCKWQATNEIRARRYFSHNINNWISAGQKWRSVCLPMKNGCCWAVLISKLPLRLGRDVLFQVMQVAFPSSHLSI